ncbi:uncharacterized [Tachysurus ichikawai]
MRNRGSLKGWDLEYIAGLSARSLEKVLCEKRCKPFVEVKREILERRRMDEGDGNVGAILVSMLSLVAAFVQKDEHVDHKANADHMIGLLLCQGSECNISPLVFL